MLELCKTKIKKSSPDKLKFYLAAAARDMVTYDDSSTRLRSPAVLPHFRRNML